MRRLLATLLVLHFVNSAAAQNRLIANGLFTDDAVWSLGQTPPFNSSAVIDLNFTATHNNSSPLVQLSSLTMSDGKLLGTGQMSIGVLDLTGGELSLSSLAVTSTLNWSGGALGKVSAFGNSNWGGAGPKTLIGTYMNLGVVRVTGLNFDSDGGRLFNASGKVIELHEAGNVFVRSNPLSSGGIIENHIGGVIRTEFFGTYNIDWLLINSGTMEIFIGDVRLTNFSTHSGVTDLASASRLQFSAGVHKLQAGGKFEGTGSVLIDGTASVEGVSSPGQFDINSRLVLTQTGSLEASSLTTVNVNNEFTWSSGTLGRQGSVVLRGNSTFTGSGDKIAGGAIGTVKNHGVLTIDGTNIKTNSTVSHGLINFGEVDIVGTGTVFAGVGKFSHNGTDFRKTTSAGVATIEWDFDNVGVVNVNKGTLRFQNGTSLFVGGTSFTNEGILEFASGTARLSAPSSGIGEFNSQAGLVKMSGATVEVFGNFASEDGGIYFIRPKTVVSGGIVGRTADNIDRTLALAGGMEWSGGTLGSGAGRVLVGTGGESATTSTWSGTTGMIVGGNGVELSGNTNLTGGNIQPESADKLVKIGIGGNFEIQSDGIAFANNANSGARGILANMALLQKNGGAGTSVIDWRLENSGNVVVNTGTLQLRGGGEVGGFLQVGNGAVLQFGDGISTVPQFKLSQVLGLGDGTIRVDNADLLASPGTSGEIAAKVVLSAGTIRTDNSLSAIRLSDGLDWTFGQVGGIGQLVIGGTSVWSGSTEKTISGLPASNLITGDVTLTGTNLRNDAFSHGLTNNGTLTIAATGNVLVNNGLPGQFVNGVVGSVIKPTTGTSTIQWSFDNAGVVEASAGILQFSPGAGSFGGFIGGSLSTVSSGIIRFNNGNFTLVNGGSAGGATAIQVVNANLNIDNDAVYTFSGKVAQSGSGGSIGGGGNANSVVRFNGGLDWTTGLLGGVGRIEIKGVQSWSGAGVKTVATSAANMQNTGTITLTTSIRSNGAGTGMTNDAGGLFVVNGAFTALSNNGLPNGQFINNQGATFRKANNNTTGVQWDFLNAGVIDVAAGTLQMTGNLQQTVDGEIVLRNNAVLQLTRSSTTLAGDLSGIGTILSAQTQHDNGDISPGFSPGVLNFAGNAAFGPGSNFSFELGNPLGVAGVDFDLINVTGDLVLDGNLIVAGLAGFGVGTYTIIDYGGTLTDNGLMFLGGPSGFDYLLVNNVLATSIQLIVSVNPVPEPTWLLIGLALPVGFFWRRRGTKTPLQSMVESKVAQTFGGPCRQG